MFVCKTEIDVIDLDLDEESDDEAEDDDDGFVNRCHPVQNTDSCNSGCPPPPSDTKQHQHGASTQVYQIGSSGQGHDDQSPMDLSKPKVKPQDQIPTAGSGVTYRGYPIGVHTNPEMDVDDCISQLVQIHSVPNTQDVEMETSSNAESDCEFACNVAENVMGVPEAIIRGQYGLPTLTDQDKTVSKELSLLCLYVYKYYRPS